LKTLVVATKNKGKLAEIRARLSMQFEVIGLDAIDREIHIVEDAPTFEGNALKKAHATIAATGFACLSDDSGLEVDYLDKRPGVLSARYGGEGLTDADRFALLLKELKGIPENLRTARFRAVLAFIEPGCEPCCFEGAVEGRIALAAAGQSGFGYDPVFIPDGFDKTMAELGPDIKSRISHRAKALDAFVKYLRNRS
jgi:XTP/dITP diphosphohydrolase